MKKIKLYHYSNKKIDNISVDKFGDNYFTLRDSQASDIKRAFYYLENKPIEYRFKDCRYTYIIEVSKNKLYDLKIDKNNLKYKYQDNIDGLLRYIKQKYQGCIYNVGYDIAILFDSVKPIKTITRGVK